MAFAIPYCSPEHYSLILSEFLRLYQDKPAGAPDALFYGDKPLKAALDRDATATEKYAAKKAFIMDSANQLKAQGNVPVGANESERFADEVTASKKDVVGAIRAAWSEFFASISDGQEILGV